MPAGRPRNENSRTQKFIVFAFASIAYDNENLIMANIQKKFYRSITPVGQRQKNGHTILNPVAVEMRKYLEYRGAILVSPLYAPYRTIRPLCRTPSFPKRSVDVVNLLSSTVDAVVSKLSWMGVKYNHKQRAAKRPKTFPF